MLTGNIIKIINMTVLIIGHPSQMISKEGTFGQGNNYDSYVADILHICIFLEPTLKELWNVLREVSSIWQLVGLQLGVEGSELDSIKAENKDDCSTCLFKMLQKWQKSTVSLSWLAVVKALESLREERKAEEICNVPTV